VKSFPKQQKLQAVISDSGSKETLRLVTIMLKGEDSISGMGACRGEYMLVEIYFIIFLSKNIDRITTGKHSF